MSRFGKISQHHRGEDSPISDPELLILLSGPEPQRSLLEASIIAQAGRDAGITVGETGTIVDRTRTIAVHTGSIVLVRGLPGGGPAIAGIPPGMAVYDHLPAAELEPLMRTARLVVARSGYSTVMDLARLGKRALLIPTPGQPEQEYLGPFLAGKGLAVCVPQSAFCLRESLALARQNVESMVVSEPESGLEAEIRTVLAMLQLGAQG